MPDSALPPNLRGKKHWDFPPGLRWIPRGWTAFKFGAPVLLFGTADFDPIVRRSKSGEFNAAPKPINPAGTWQISYFPDAPWWSFPVYFSWSGKTKADGKFRNFRVGPRWDDVDGYVNYVPLAPSSRRYTGAPDEDTST
jgi:hypothetical protein